MNLILVIFALLWVSVACHPRKLWDWYGCLRTTLVLGFGGLAALLLLNPWGAGVIALGPAQVLAIAWAGWCAATCMWSHAPEFSFRHVLRQVGFVGAFLVVSSGLTRSDLVLVACVGAFGLLINIAHATRQYLLGNPWHKGAKKTFGTLGNRNWYASYVVGAVGFVIYLGATLPPAWLVVPPCALLTLWACLTLWVFVKQPSWRSKGSMLSFGLGTVFIGLVVSPMIIGCVVAFGLIIAASFYRDIIEFVHSHRTIAYRFRYWRAGLWLIRKRPLLGHGMRMFRREIYRAHVGLNEVTKGEFLNKNGYPAPQPRETHNDYIGFAVETGLIGTGLFVSVLVVLVWNGIQAWGLSGDLGVLALMFGVVSLAANALVFFPLRTPASGMVFWILLGMLDVQTGTTVLTPITLPALAQVLTCLVICIPTFVMAWRYVRLNHYAEKATKEGNPTALREALRYDKHNSTLLTGALPSTVMTDSIAACACAYKVIEHYDGDTTPWHMWTAYGELRLGLGSIPEAKRSFEIALRMLPHFTPALNGLDQCDKILASGNQIVIDFSGKQFRQPPTQGSTQ